MAYNFLCPNLDILRFVFHFIKLIKLLWLEIELIFYLFYTYQMLRDVHLFQEQMPQFSHFKTIVKTLYGQGLYQEVENLY